MGWFYISFATEEKFLGATVVEAGDDKDAIFEATLKGLNPGGEAAIVEVPVEAQQEVDFQFMKYKLCSRAEILALGGRPYHELNDEQKETFDTTATRVCEKHNVRH